MENLPPAHHLRQRHAAILLPLLDRLGAIHEDDEVVVLALVVDLGLGVVSLHDD